MYMAVEYVIICKADRGPHGLGPFATRISMIAMESRNVFNLQDFEYPGSEVPKPNPVDSNSKSRPKRAKFFAGEPLQGRF